MSTFIRQGLRNAFQALQGWQIEGSPVTTEGPPEFLKTQASIMAFPLEHIKGGPASRRCDAAAPASSGLDSRFS